MYRQLIAILLVLFAGFAHATVTLCPVVSGGLHLNCSTPRSTGIAPLLVNFDCTTTTDTNPLGGAGTVTQDIQYLWNFSDPGVTGKGNWLYGSGSAYQSKNLGTGIVQAHLYDVADGAGNMSTVAVVTANDGTNTASCGVAITAYDPIGANGFTAANTTCYSSSGTFTGCPTGANHVTVGTIAAVNGNLTNKRLLYRCGETFTGDSEAPSGSGWTIGAFPPLGQSGSCAETKTNRPVFSDTIGGSTYTINTASVLTNIRITDIDFEGNVGGAIQQFTYVLSIPTPSSQMTLNNINTNGHASTVLIGQANQTGIINGSYVERLGGGNIAMFLNSEANNCVNFSSAYNCGGTPNFININYLALIGNKVTGTGGTGGNIEGVRIGTCRYCTITNNYLDDAISLASNLKYGSANTVGSCGNWLGQATQYAELSDNNFGTVAQGMEVAPQNPGVDERHLDIIMERNISLTATGSGGNRGSFTSGQNITVRNNIMVMATSGSNYVQLGYQPGARAACTLTGTCNNSGSATNCAQTGTESVPGFLPTGQEYYNNTCYAPTGHPLDTCVANDTTGGWTPAQNSIIQNNMMYVATGSGYSTTTNTGTGNTVTNNTANASNTSSPGFKNGSGGFNLMTDFKPTANYSGGTSVPNQTDALGVNWLPTWDLGAVHH
jgi:hypothetical protein